jgi:hypothetical protein
LSSNYLRIDVQGRFVANKWVDVMISEREDGIVGEPAT